MHTKYNINSDAYWDSRFAEDWESHHGPAQSRFFARLAIDNLPRWLLEQLQRQPLTLCDWGCAQGDGTDIWASHVDSERITGIDFSAVAIAQAAERYPAIRFKNEDWLTAEPSESSAFDIVFSSNTLEHFHKPYAVLTALCKQATKALVLALPYRELDRHEEHFYTFLPANIPSIIDGGFKLVWSRVVDCRQLPNTLWGGDQIILVYAKSDWVDSLALTLQDYSIEQINSTTTIDSLSQAVAARDGQIASLNQAVTERDGQIASLNQAVTERDGQIASLNQVVTERDGQIASLNQAVTERDSQISDLKDAATCNETRIQELTSSSSWRITSPLRLMKRLITASSRKNSRYALLKSIYWRLPEPLRNLLNKKRHKFVAKHLREYGGHFIPSHSNNSTDPTTSANWITQANTAKKIAVITCGFEFDELVNQRPINAAKHYSKRGFLVLYIAWQWSPKDILSKGSSEVFPNVIQVPLYEYLNNHNALTLENKAPQYLLTMPARQFTDSVDTWRSKGGIVIYDIMDEWEEFYRVGQAPWYDKNLEQELVLKADFVTAVSPSLSEKFRNIRKDIFVIGNGYSPNILGTEKKGIANNIKNEKIVVGYFGHLTDAWFDWDLLFSTASQAMHLKFEIIGYGEPEWIKTKIKDFDNIVLIGKVLPADLHTHVSRWNIGIIPFIESNLSIAVDPIKIYEYLYFGLPTVVTGIEHLKSYPRTYFSTRSNIHESINKAINDDTSIDKLNDFLNNTTWEARFDSLLDLVSTKNSFSALYEK